MKKPQALIGLLAALGTAIGVLVAVVGLPYGRMSYSAFAEVYHNGSNTTGLVTMAIDCDITTPGTQDGAVVGGDNCTYNPAALPAGMQVDVTLGNETASNFMVSAFAIYVNNPNSPKFGHIPVAPDPSGFAGNPDFNGVNPGTDPTDTIPPPDVVGSFNCGSPAPGDTGGSPATINKSTLLCNNGAGNGPVIVAGNPVHLVLGRVSYSFADTDGVAAGAQPSTAVSGDIVTLSLSDMVVFDDTFSEVGSCNPVVTTAGFCGTANINFLVPPTNTPAPPTNTPVPATATNTPTATNTFTPVPPTNTPTNTFTPTNTATPVPGASVIKIPESCIAPGGPNCDPNAGGPGFAAANLWLCNGACAGPGEGNLVVFEYASSVLTAGDIGVGAYEFQVEYDNFVIQSVNPCDVVFSNTAGMLPTSYPNGTDGVADGEGIARGTVDQVNSSGCGNDPVSGNNGTCNYSFILENLVRFGCVTNGQTNSGVGVTGNTDFDMARLNLVPHPDLSNDIFPGNNNGVITVIKDNGCEIVDRLGHAELGNVNGGLTASCRDLAVTVRILEGDTNLDCTVDVTDAANIALHYGGFFGSLLYSKWLDLEPATHDLDIDIKDLQKVFGRIGSTCQNPIPAQPPAGYPAPPGN